MKTAILPIAIILLVWIIPQNVTAQERQYGIKAGVNAYTLISEVAGTESASDPKVGFEGGVFGDFPISRILSIQLEVLYSRKGGKESSETIGTSSLTLNYIDVPMILKIKAPISGNFEPYIFGGGYGSYLLGATSDSNGNSQDITKFLYEFNYGAKLGLGVSFGKMVIDARYDMGLADIFSEEGDVSADEDFKLTMNGIAVAVGITF